MCRFGTESNRKAIVDSLKKAEHSFLRGFEKNRDNDQRIRAEEGNREMRIETDDLQD